MPCCLSALDLPCLLPLLAYDLTKACYVCRNAPSCQLIVICQLIPNCRVCTCTTRWSCRTVPRAAWMCSTWLTTPQVHQQTPEAVMLCVHVNRETTACPTYNAAWSSIAEIGTLCQIIMTDQHNAVVQLWMRCAKPLERCQAWSSVSCWCWSG